MRDGAHFGYLALAWRFLLLSIAFFRDVLERLLGISSWMRNTTDPDSATHYSIAIPMSDMCRYPRSEKCLEVRLGSI